jgi:transmembrane sensor
VTFGALKPEWLIRRQAGRLLARIERDPNAKNIAALDQWRAAHARHAEVLRGAEAALRYSLKLPPPPSSMAAASNDLKRTEERRRTGVAASIVIATLGIPALYFGAAGLIHRPQIEAVLLTTDLGEIREVALADGSKVVLDTSSRVRVRLGPGGREATVERGRARFSVARGGAPFMIHSAQADLRIDRGTVDVVNEPHSHIELLDGTANLRQGSEELALAAPAAIDGVGTAEQRLYKPPPSRVDWTKGWLSFERATLEEVANASNRYTARKIVISDPAIAALRVTGVYRTGDAVALAKSLAKAFDLKVAADPSGNVRLVR